MLNTSEPSDQFAELASSFISRLDGNEQPEEIKSFNQLIKELRRNGRTSPAPEDNGYANDFSDEPRSGTLGS